MGSSNCCHQKDEAMGGADVIIAQLSGGAAPPRGSCVSSVSEEEDDDDDDEDCCTFSRPSRLHCKDIKEDAGEEGEDSQEKASDELVELSQEALLARRRTHLTLTFATHLGQAFDVTFQKKPLGLDFYRCLPITIKRVHSGSCAQELGLEPHMVLVRVDLADTSSKTLVEMRNLLTQVSSELPEG